MDEHPELGSTWKGRILFYYEAQDCKYPEHGVVPIENYDKTILETKEIEGFLKQVEYEMIAEIGQGIYLPEQSGKDIKYRIKLSVGSFS